VIFLDVVGSDRLPLNLAVRRTERLLFFKLVLAHGVSALVALLCTSLEKD